MSTLSLDDQLYKQAVAAAGAQGMSVEQFVSKALRQAVGKLPSYGTLRRTARHGLPVIIVGNDVVPIDPLSVRQSLEEEGF